MVLTANDGATGRGDKDARPKDRASKRDRDKKDRDRDRDRKRRKEEGAEGPPAGGNAGGASRLFGAALGGRGAGSKGTTEGGKERK